MKTIMISVLLAFSMIAGGQDTQIPDRINAAFTAKYPGLKVDDCSVYDNLYSFEFYKHGSMFTAVFDKDGAWLETAEIISDMSLPASLQAYIKKNYPSGCIGYSEDVEDHSSVHYYRVTVTDGQKSVIIKCDTEGKKITAESVGT